MIASAETETAYSFKPFAGSSHWVILNTLSRLAPPLRICDVGTGEGHLARECRAKGHYVVGIDRRPAPASFNGWDRFISADVSRPPIPGLAPDETFDVILLADILEHIPDPGALLTGMLRHSTPRTKFIISVPNVANLYVRLHLLSGRFDYAERGILDAGHFRFFTLASFRRFILESRLKVENLWGTSIPWPLVWPALFDGGRYDWINRLSFHTTNSWKGLLAYQFVAVAGPAQDSRS